MKKICFITTSRADFGMINEIVKESAIKKKVSTYLIISGSHNENVFGKTINEIKMIKSVKIIKIKSDQRNKNDYSVVLSFSDHLKKFAQCLKNLKPDYFVVFGDRYEMLAASISAYIQKIPLIHIAGGEKTFGSLDEGYRHSITKLSNLHFPTSKIYRKRIIQLGEQTDTVFNFGSLNRQKIFKASYYSRQELEKKFKINFLKRNILLTFHPENTKKNKNLKNLSLILNCLKTLNNTRIIATAPNADAEGIKMLKLINAFVKKNKKKFRLINSLGTKGYLSMLKIVDGVIGNSSSGISEVPLFSIKTINLGNRQGGREMPKSVINCEIKKNSILKNLKKLKRANDIKKNNFRDKFVAKKIMNKIMSFNFKKYDIKNFRDI